MLRGLQTPQIYVGSTIIFTPHTAQAQHTFTYWYMPSCQLLTMDLPTARCQDHGPADASDHSQRRSYKASALHRHTAAQRAFSAFTAGALDSAAARS